MSANRTPNWGKPGLSLWRQLTEPAASIQSPDKARTAQLLSSLLLMTLVAIIIDVVYASCSSGFPPVVFAAGVVVAIAYSLSRTRYYNVAAWLSLAVLSVPFFASTLGDADVSEAAVRAHLVWLMLPILLSGLLLSTSGLVVATAAIFAGVLLLPMLNPALSLRSIVGALGIVFTTSGLIVVFIHHYRQMERERQARLRESEEKYRSLAESAPDIIMIVDRDGVISFINRAVSGFTIDETIGASIYDYIDAEHHDRVKQCIEQVFETGEPGTYEITGRGPHGITGCYFTVVGPIEHEGQVVNAMHISRDITKRKQTEEALRENEEWLESVLTASAVGIAYAKDRKILWANDAMAKLFGFTEDEQYLGKDTKMLYASEEEYKRVGEIAYEQQRSGRVVEFDAEFKRQDGSPFDGHVKVNTLDPLDPVRGIIVSIIDITERKQAEEEREQLLAQIQEQAQRVQHIVDTVPEGVILLGSDLRVLLANPLGKKDLATLASVQVGDVLTHLGDRSIEELLTSPPKGLWHEVATDHRSFQVIARPIENGPIPKGWVLVVRDVTQQREVERRIQQQERLATVGQLAAGMAHDFNNIMAVVALYADLSLRAPDLPEEVRERLQTIGEQAHRASRLIQQILDFSRRAVLERGPLDLVAFLKEQVKLLQRTLPEHIQIDLSYDEGEYTVNADSTRIQQVVMNLATNARDAMPEGGRLHFILERIAFGERDTPPLPEMKPGRWIRLTVADTGIGILPEMQPHVFDPFFTTKEPGKGSGLGMAQVYGIVKQHEGHIDFTTEPGRGTSFTLYLPALAVPQPSVTAVETEPLPQGQGQTILVVEDGAATRRALVESLAALNYRILEATNGQQALKVFEQHAGAIDLVLSDVVMPEMGGKALLYALQERDPAVRVVLLTGHPLDEQELGDLHASGLRSWILKPLDLEQLARIVAEVLSPASR
jgi:two-component system cell cycle sensor histidine kinase/response regulator CckA